MDRSPDRNTRPAPAGFARPPAAASARFARYGAPDEPPMVEDISGDPAAVIDALFVRVADCSCIPPIAAREIIENLAHAAFEGACVSVLDNGATLRVADCGPGIPEPERAMQPGFSTACGRLRDVIRGVGSGLPVTAAALAGAGGSLSIDPNLGRGTVVTLQVPVAPAGAATGNELSEHARRVLAVLVEVGPAAPERLARELDVSLAECARELVVLEHRELVDRDADGRRSLTPTGTSLLSTLF